VGTSERSAPLVHSDSAMAPALEQEPPRQWAHGGGGLTVAPERCDPWRTANPADRWSTGSNWNIEVRLRGRMVVIWNGIRSALSARGEVFPIDGALKFDRGISRQPRSEFHVGARAHRGSPL